MKPGEIYTDPNTGKSYEAKEGRSLGDCTGCVNDIPLRKKHCKTFPICYPNKETDWYDLIFVEHSNQEDQI